MPFAHRTSHRRLPTPKPLPVKEAVKIAEETFSPTVETPKPFRAHDWPEPELDVPTSFRCMVNDHKNCKGFARTIERDSPYGRRAMVNCGCDCHKERS